MIARLRGNLVERRVDGVAARLVIDCQGVGYEVACSLATMEALPEPEGAVVLRIHTQASENRVALYGFATDEERALFDVMITVQNVGPRTALEMLSTAPSTAALAQMIASGDVKALHKLKGVGKKTADMLVAKVRDKCEFLLATWTAAGTLAGASIAVSRPTPARPNVARRDPMLEDVASALGNLGWRHAEVDKVLERLDIPPGATVEVLLRDALRAMPR